VEPKSGIWSLAFILFMRLSLAGACFPSQREFKSEIAKLEAKSLSAFCHLEMLGVPASSGERHRNHLPILIVILDTIPLKGKENLGDTKRAHNPLL